MYTHILISTDGSDLAQRGVDHGLTLAKALGAKVTILTVTERFPFQATSAGAGWVPSATDIESYEQGQKELAQEVLDGVKRAVAEHGVKATYRHEPDAWAAEAILATGKSDGCDLVVMASHGRRGLGRLILGSQTAEVLAHSDVPVLVVK